MLLFPIAVSTALGLGVDPKPFIMAVCFGASACFATPVGYQTNLLVYGPGGYRFSDYLKRGLPLNLAVLMLGGILIPVIWPFQKDLAAFKIIISSQIVSSKLDLADYIFAISSQIVVAFFVLDNFYQAVQEVFKPKLLIKKPDSWKEALSILTTLVEAQPAKKKIILFFDELPWPVSYTHLTLPTILLV